jgi:hypothetical protein
MVAVQPDASQGVTMIAQVMTAKAAELSDEMRKFVEDGLAEARRREGVEGIVWVFDPAAGESLSVHLFRDQAAADAFQAFLNEKLAQAEELGAEVDRGGRVYTEVIALL